MYHSFFKGNPVTIDGNQLAIGDKAPNFTAIKPDLTPWTLYETHGVKIISTIPSLDTGVCSLQTKRFNREASSLLGLTVIAMSLDLPFAQARWCGSEGVDNIVVVSDYQNRDFAFHYSLLIKEVRLIARSVIVLDSYHKVTYTEYLPDMSQEPNYTAAIDAAKQLL